MYFKCPKVSRSKMSTVLLSHVDKSHSTDRTMAPQPDSIEVYPEVHKALPNIKPGLHMLADMSSELRAKIRPAWKTGPFDPTMGECLRVDEHGNQMFGHVVDAGFLCQRFYY